MKLNLTDAEATPPPLEMYTGDDTWWDQATAAKTKVEATGLMNSRDNYHSKAFSEQLQSMRDEDPDNEESYAEIESMDIGKLKFYEDQYKAGELEDSLMSSGFQDFNAMKHYFDTVSNSDRYDLTELRDYGDGLATRDYREAEMVKGDSWTAQIAGSIAGMASNPMELASYAMGGGVVKGAVQTILGTAMRAAGQEAVIAGAIAVPQKISEYNRKKELNIDYTVREAAVDALLEVGTAGLLRATGSASWDLTADGLKALKAKDRPLFKKYQQLEKGNISGSTKEHTDNLKRTEAGLDVNIEKPNPKAQKIMDRPETDMMYAQGKTPQFSDDYRDVIANNIAGIFPEKFTKEVDELVDKIFEASKDKFDASNMIPKIIADSRVKGKDNSTATSYLQSNNMGESYGMRWTKNYADPTWNITQKQAERIFNGKATANDIKRLGDAVDSRLAHETEIYEMNEYIDYDGEIALHMGTDADGVPIAKTYDELDAEFDADMERIKMIEDCLL